MTPIATLAWFARHELRLSWRDLISMLTGGKRRREPVVALIVIIIAVLIQLLAFVLVAPFAAEDIALDRQTLVVVTGSIIFYSAMMVSQTMESVTRVFYTRADLDLILSSPAPRQLVFAVRMAAIWFSTALLMTVLAGPLINALVCHDGVRWLAGYGVVVALSALSTALALIMVVVLFRTVGPKRTRAISQVVSAVIGSAFVISIQVVAILSTGSISRVSLLRSNAFVDHAPHPSSLLWWPAHAAAGDMAALAALVIVGIGALTLVILAISERFAEYVVAAASIESQNGKKFRVFSSFQPVSVKRTLKRKEWLLIRRDPWLMSQSLMQILYMVPAVVLLWKSFGDHMDALLILVAVIVMASGQLAGGLAWLAVSGEDAPDLIGSAPVSANVIVAAKFEAVLGLVALAAVPVLIGLALAAPQFALVATLGVIISSGSAIMVQIWFRGQAKRSDFRRRQISSRLATLSEALSCILWASVALLAAAGNWIALVPAILARLTLAAAWMIRPRQVH